MDQEITLRIILEKPTPGVVYGLQKGKGSNYDTIQKQISTSKDLHFECAVQVKSDKSQLIFLGPFTQGPPAERFIYIDIGTYAGQKNTPWSRRLKIPLRDIPSDITDKLSSSSVLQTKVPGSGGKDGGPSCGTVKPFEGWKLINQNIQ